MTKSDKGKGEAREDAREARAKRRARRTTEPREGGALEWVKSLAVALVLFFVLRTFLVQTFVITSGSMEDTLLVGDMLLVNRAAMGSRVPILGARIPGYSRPQRGDVLVFDPPHEESLMLIKRLVGLPGDTLEMREKVLYVNGAVLDEAYLKHDTLPDERHPWMAWQTEHLLPGHDAAGYAPTRDNWGPLLIPEDHYFMLGDNRERSLDSRYWGLIEGWRLEGRAVFTYYSYNRDSFRPFPAVREVRWNRIGRPIR